MISIGNDIVALNSINKQRTNHIRFHSKFITPAELALYQYPTINHIPFESFIWLLWSVKESVFKYQKRLNAQLIFSPTKIAVQHINIPVHYTDKPIDYNSWEGEITGDDFCNGHVIAGGQILHFKSIIHDQLIATVVSDDPSFQGIYCGIQAIKTTDHESQSWHVREFMLQKLKTIFPQNDLVLQNSAVGYPVLLVNGKDAHVPISIAHQGQFVCYSFKLPTRPML